MSSAKASLAQMFGDLPPQPTEADKDAALKQRVKNEIYLGAPESEYKNGVLALVNSDLPLSDDSRNFLKRQLERQDKQKKDNVNLVEDAIGLIKAGHLPEKQKTVRSIIQFYIEKEFLSPKQRAVLKSFVGI